MLEIIIIWFIHIAQYGIMCWICTLTRQESEKTGRCVHEIVFNCKPVNLGKINEAWNHSSFEMRSPLNESDSEQISSSSHNLNNVVLENYSRRNLDRDCIRKEINDFSIQLYPVAFTVCNFFEINNALFSGVSI